MIVRFTDKSGAVDIVADSRRVNYGGLVALRDLAIDRSSTGIICMEVIDHESNH